MSQLTPTSFWGMAFNNGTTRKVITLIDPETEAEDGVEELVDGSYHDIYEGGQSPLKPKAFSFDIMLIHPTKEAADIDYNLISSALGNYSTLSATDVSGNTYTCPARLLKTKKIPLFSKGQATKNLRINLEFQPFQVWTAS